MLSTPTRRALIGGAGIAAVVAAAPIVAAASPISAGLVSDPQWQALVAHRHAANAAWLAASDNEDSHIELFQAELKTLRPEPKSPFTPGGAAILDKTVRELRDACHSLDTDAAWLAYERDRDAWQKDRDALRERIVGRSSAQYRAATKAENAAMAAVVAYPVQCLADLGEKTALILKEWDDGDVPAEHVSALLADMRRLAKKEA